MQMWGLENETDGWRDGRTKGGNEEAIIVLMNEGGGRNPRAITPSLRQPSVALTSLSWHSHINTLPQIRAQRRSAGERISQDRSGFSGASQFRLQTPPELFCKSLNARLCKNVQETTITRQIALIFDVWLNSMTLSHLKLQSVLQTTTNK